jgi:hypothetical protein
MKDTSFESFEEALITEKDWNKSEKFQLKTLEDYNEFNYFYDFTREVMYELSDDLKGETLQNSHSIIRHYEYRLGDNPTYTINEKFELEVESILLNVYDTGVGVLSFHLANFKHKEVADILAINQDGRRIFVPSFGYDLANIGNLIGDNAKHYDFEKAYKLLVANKIVLNTGNKNEIWTEDFSVNTITKDFQSEPFVIPAFIKGLFTEKKENLSPNYNRQLPQMGKVDIYPVLDDRMFVVCWYGNNALSKSVKDTAFWEENSNYVKNCWEEAKKKPDSTKEEKSEKEKALPLHTFYELLYIDKKGDLSCQNSQLILQHLRSNTYLRWSDYNSFYGMSRFSFVLLTNDLATLKSDGSSYLIKHQQGIYYKMVELCLVQRASVLRFSDETTEVADEIKRNKETRQIREKISDLYKDYIRFVNKIYFREITAQEQGIEIYDMLHKTMRMSEQVKDLDDEIEELHNYASAQEEKGLNRVASQFLPASFLAALLAIVSDKHELIDWKFNISQWDWDIISFCSLLIAFVLLSLVSYKFIFKILNFKLWKKK